MTEGDVAGTVEVTDEDGTFELPERYFEADAVVIRDPSKTVNMPSGAPKREWYYDPTVDRNPELAPDKVSLKVHGEDAEVFRVEGIDQIDVDA
jgi:hypothetical protein